MRPGRAFAAALVAASLVSTVCGGAPAQTPPGPADYHPSMGDLMTMAVQPRHTKLGLASRARNWKYAAYEAGELRGAFGRVARTIPTYRKADVADMIAANVKSPLDAIDAAIAARDAAGFKRAYADLTKSCNDCHQGLGHPEVVIQAPLVGAYPDQVFTPN
jgi:hypothetical protein